VEALLRRKPDAVLGLATGSTPLPIYAELARRHERDGLDFSQARAFALDEYAGLPAGHPQSYREVIAREFTARVNVSPANVHVPDGAATDIPAACQRYEDSIRDAGGVDLQLLGVGTDGHIGFNEPGSSLASRTRIKTLIEQTRRDNARFFGSLADVPHHVLTRRPKPCGTSPRARSPPSAPPPCCSCTGMPPSWSTRRRRPHSGWPITTATATTTNPPGRACRCGFRTFRGTAVGFQQVRRLASNG
jgi:hypothetical protein